ncbi:TPA: hypothetical protein RKX89_000210 [Enterobacter ludwigii]|nr:hypothetical protein [Enterobacter ludwigii]
MSDILSGYPGNGDYPKTYLPVTITTRSRRPHHSKLSGSAYWSGCKWVGLDGFKIGYAKVIKWEFNIAHRSESHEETNV